jgi:hypothetical protein
MLCLHMLCQRDTSMGWVCCLSQRAWWIAGGNGMQPGFLLGCCGCWRERTVSDAEKRTGRLWSEAASSSPSSRTRRSAPPCNAPRVSRVRWEGFRASVQNSAVVHTTAHAVCVARHAAIHMHPQRKGSTAGWPTWFPPMSIPTDAMFARLSDRLVAPPLVGLHAHKHEASLPLCTNLSSPSLSPQQSKQHGRCGVTPCDTVRRPSCSLHRCLRSIGTHIPELWG